MRPVRALSLYILAVFLGGALLAPWLYELVHLASQALPGLQAIASKPFPRYVNRAFLILGLAGLFPFLRAADLASWTALGLGRRPKALVQLSTGFALGLISLACIVLLALYSSARRPAHDHPIPAILVYLLKAGLTAALVAPLEELFFRGALFGALRKTFHWPLALIISSSIYALLHFLERPGWQAPVTWTSGLLVLAGMVSGFSDLTKLIPGFLNLTVVGLILGLAYQRTGSLYFSIGLHAGWIFWLKTYGFLTQDGGPSWIWFFGSGKLIDGWLAFLTLAALFLILRRFILDRQSQGSSWKERQLFCG